MSYILASLLLEDCTWRMTFISARYINVSIVANAMLNYTILAEWQTSNEMCTGLESGLMPKLNHKLSVHNHNNALTCSS